MALCFQVQPEDRGEKHLDEKRPGKLQSAILAAVIIIAIPALVRRNGNRKPNQ